MKRGFSLVELSIVLVILGLLTGGILAGQSLIRAAELRSISTESQRFITAANTFRDKYFALPGDMNNAGKFWGTDTTSNCAWNSTSSTANTTCNGDGNGQIFINYTTPSNEPFRAWQHLASAGLIEGSYTGLCNPCYAGGGGGAVIGSNVPRSKISNAGWFIDYLGDIPFSDTQFMDGSYGNALFFGTVNTAGFYGGFTYGASLKPEEAWNIDTKMDDGKPATGRVVTLETQGGSGATTCSDIAGSNSATMSASAYRLDNSGVNCSLIIKTGF